MTRRAFSALRVIRVEGQMTRTAFSVLEYLLYVILVKGRSPRKHALFFGPLKFTFQPRRGSFSVFL